MTGKPSLKALRSQDALSGLLFMAVAAVFALLAKDLSLGTALRMGAGYFPLVLSGLLGCLGLGIFLRALWSEGTPAGALSWRGPCLVTLSVLVLGFGLHGLGLGPAVAVGTVLATLASGRVTLLKSVLLAAFLVVFTWGVFIYGLALPIPLIGAWLS